VPRCDVRWGRKPDPLAQCRPPRVRQFAFKNSHFYPMPSTFKRVSSRIL